MDVFITHSEVFLTFVIFIVTNLDIFVKNDSFWVAYLAFLTWFLMFEIQKIWRKIKIHQDNDIWSVVNDLNRCWAVKCHSNEGTTAWGLKSTNISKPRFLSHWKNYNRSLSWRGLEHSNESDNFRLTVHFPHFRPSTLTPSWFPTLIKKCFIENHCTSFWP